MRLSRFILVLVPVAALYAGHSPLTQVHQIGKDAQGNPLEEVIDITVNLHGKMGTPQECAGDNDGIIVPNDSTQIEEYKICPEVYEEIMGHFADGLYEMTNGANYLGKVRFFTGNSFEKGADIDWPRCGSGWANPGALNHAGKLYAGDFYEGGGLGVCKPFEVNFNRVQKQGRRDYGYFLLHEAMHYFYGLLDEYGAGEIRQKEFHFSISSGSLLVTDNNQKISIFRDAFKKKQVVFFILPDATISRLPAGLIAKKEYRIASIDSLSSTTVRFEFYDPITNQKIQINDLGVGQWHFQGRDNSASSLYSVAWCQRCADGYGGHQGENNPPHYQWLNFSNDYTKDQGNPQGRNFRRTATNAPMSQWEAVTTDPETQDGYNGWPRYFFRSLLSKKPTDNDVVTFQTGLSKDIDPESQALDIVLNFEKNNMREVTLKQMRFMLPMLGADSLFPRKHLRFEWLGNPTLQVHQVIDRSGSMDSVTDFLGKKRMDMVKFAAQSAAEGFLYENFENSGTVIPRAYSDIHYSLTSFNHNVTQLVQNAYQPLADTISNRISQLIPSGPTALYQAVLQAIEGFQDIPGSQRYLLIYSDGEHNVGDMKVDTLLSLLEEEKIKGSPITIFAYAYGKDAHFNDLQKLVEATDGYFVPNKKGYFSFIQKGVLPAAPVSPGGQLLSTAPLSQTQEYRFVVSTSQGQVLIEFSNGEGNLPQFQLISPSGEIVDDYAPGTFEFDTTIYRRLWLSTNQQQGIWRIVATSPGAASVSTSQFSPPQAMGPTLHLDLSGRDVDYPNPMIVWATIQDRALIGGATVTAQVVSNESGQVIHSVALNDEGRGMDAEGRDGIYSGEIFGIPSGDYELLVSAQGDSGSLFYPAVQSQSNPRGELEYTTPFHLQQVESFRWHQEAADDHPNTISQAHTALSEVFLNAVIDYSDDIDALMIPVPEQFEDYILMVSGDSLFVRVWNSMHQLVEERWVNSLERFSIPHHSLNWFVTVTAATPRTYRLAIQGVKSIHRVATHYPLVQESWNGTVHYPPGGASRVGAYLRAPTVEFDYETLLDFDIPRSEKNYASAKLKIHLSQNNNVSPLAISVHPQTLSDWDPSTVSYSTFCLGSSFQCPSWVSALTQTEPISPGATGWVEIDDQSLLNWVNQVANGQIENRGLVLTANSWYYGYYFTVDRVELEVE